MFSAILSFLGGNIFRMLWGEVSAWITAKQEHKFELDRLRLQEELDKASHERRLEVVRLEAEKQIQIVQVKAEADLSAKEMDGFIEAVKLTGKTVGLLWVDAWNAVIRPFSATWALGMITGHYIGWWILDENGWALSGAALGIYLADRSLFKRGK